MEIRNVWANRESPIGRWYPTVSCRAWHQRLRLYLIKLLMKSLCRDFYWSRIDTS